MSSDSGNADAVLKALLSRRDKRREFSNNRSERFDNIMQQQTRNNQENLTESQNYISADSDESFNQSVEVPENLVEFYQENSKPKQRKSQIRQKVVKAENLCKRSPESASSFEEQIEIVGSLLCERLKTRHSISAFNLTKEWLDCILDENDSFYPSVYENLMTLDKEQLLNYLRVLISASR